MELFVVFLNAVRVVSEVVSENYWVPFVSKFIYPIDVN